MGVQEAEVCPKLELVAGKSAPSVDIGKLIIPVQHVVGLPGRAAGLVAIGQIDLRKSDRGAVTVDGHVAESVLRRVIGPVQQAVLVL